MNTQRTVYEYPDAGMIVFDEILVDQNIVIFTFNSGNKGYFDLLSGTAVFEEYNRKQQ
ncbi:hypothetical protein Cst_c14520 [Thermoclostridium stercorarium subsp. stercorarium DSM 8532]|jgi:hypothetical protein|uniref:Uncharacterized protein n=1 Tax=Thermoclostridium stercorarium (strain ATCC 35414 / DSM 8532 / NCIMB 11754) TaxID=1121335 RepID=L7VNT2_THES1|nr:hypothetical protein [Thermoclostridium stercorarium]AGC68442.1 hypothetical protein Cst_c14520 [Thermoclostridium stercorarium subsp. stercorarium DSM 8532]UZQ84438.1 hypothetical protein ODU73_001444 [Thermoclostridium stercorarium]